MGGRGGSSASAGRGSGIDRILAESSGDAAIDGIVSYMQDTYGIEMSGMGNLPVESVVDVARGIEDVLKEYPNGIAIDEIFGSGYEIDVRASNLKSSTYASCCVTPSADFSSIRVNMAKFGDYDSLVNQYDVDVSMGWHPQGTTSRQVTSHEMGHAIEANLVNKKYASDPVFNVSGASYDFQNHTEAKRVVNNAASKVKSTSAGKGKTTKALRSEISGYADSTKNGRVSWGETFAEAVADYAANGSNAKPLSVAIHDELKSELG